MSAIEAFLDGILDYAGLFPPARLDLQTALSNFEFYQRHPMSRMLARFVLPLELLTAPQLPPRVSLVCRGEEVELPLLPPEVECVEVSGSLALEPGRFVFHEIDWREDFEPRMPRQGGVKLRTGGLTPDAVPPAETIARFLIAAAVRHLPVKFTAGLHNPVPAAGALGFFNVFAAAFAAYSGCTDAEKLIPLIAEADYEAFRFTETVFHAGTFSFSQTAIERLRRERVISFGSCSFLEPVEHLERHGYLSTQ